MKLDIPFYRQTTKLNCGPTALKMVLSYFGKDKEIGVFEDRIRIKEGKGVSTIRIATAAASFGFRTDLYTKYLLFDERNLEKEFYQKYSDTNLEQSKKWIEEAKNAGVNLNEEVLLLDQVLGFMTEDSVLIVLLDWNRIKKEKDYEGHFVVVAGYDEENVYVHNPGLNTGHEFMPISRDLFDEARRADGTDEDIVVVHRK